MDSVFKSAKWITQSYLVDERINEGKVSAFRNDYVLKEKPQSCLLHIAAFKSCVLWINGKRIYNSHIRFWAKHVRYDSIEIAPFLKKGNNTFAVVLTAPTGSLGYGEFVRSALMMYGEALTGEDSHVIQTDGTWHGCPASWYGFGEYMISVPTTYQEHYNGYVKEPAGWKINKKYLAWPVVFLLGGVGTPPFYDMSPRDILYLEEKEAACVCVWTGRGETKKKRFSGEPAKCFNREEKTGEKVCRDGADAYDNRSENIYTFDFGKTAYIRPGIEVLEKHGSVRAEFYYSLKLDEKPEANTAFGFACEGFADSFTPTSGSKGWEALSPRGFRFMTVKIAGDGYLKFRIKSRLVEYPYGAAYEVVEENEQSAESTEIVKNAENVETAESAETAVVRSIWNTAAETLRSGTNDVIVDTCSRENVLWTFDAMVGGKAAWYTFGDSRMWRRCLVLAGEGVEENGNFRTVVPSGDSFMKLLDQNLYWVRSCWEYYELTGDKTLLEEMEPMIYSLLSFCSRYITEEDLFSPPDYIWHWVDWANIDKRPYSLPINCILLHAAQAGEKIADVLADGNLEEKSLGVLSRSIAERLLPACSSFFDASLGSFVSHMEPKGEKPVYNDFGFLPPEKVTPLSIHAVMLAVSCGCGTDEMRRRSMETMAGLLRENPTDPQVMMGPGWTEILLSVLFDYGYDKEAVQYVKTHYGRYIQNHAPTYGEGFGNGDMFNTAHSWGSSVNSLIARYQEKFGVQIK